MHGAVQSRLPASNAWATLDLKLQFPSPINPDGRLVTGRARVVHQGRRVAVAVAEIYTADGKPAALADASVMVLPHRRWADLAALTDEPDEIDVRALDA